MSASPNATNPKNILDKMSSNRVGRFLLRIPPVARWALSTQLGNEREAHHSQETRPIPLITGTDAQADSQSVIDNIVRDVVKILDCVGAGVAIYEKGEALVMRATYIDRNILAEEKLQEWEYQLSKFTPERPFRLSSPQVMRFYPNNPEYSKNIAVLAAKSEQIEKSNDLYDLFYHILPHGTRHILRAIQHSVGIEQISAIPFFLNTTEEGKSTREYIGNLFIASQKPLKESQCQILLAFTRHIALTILSERRHTHLKLTQRLALNAHRLFTDEQKALDAIAEGIVKEMGYAGAMVATYEDGGVLPVKAIYVDPTLVSLEQIHTWEEKVSAMLPEQKRITLFDPAVARVFMDDPRYEDNLSVRAAIARKPIVSDELFDLFTPIAPNFTRSLIFSYQRRIGIKQVVSVPFFLDDQFVGNLFAATGAAKFASWEIDALQTFGYQAAAGLRNARLYKQAEERRAATEILGRMAFGAATSVHTMRNHIGVVRGNLQLLDNIDALADDNEKRRELFQKLVPPVTERINDMVILLDNLRNPWAAPRREKVDVNFCLRRGLSKATDDTQKWIFPTLSKNLPMIEASEEILTEIFRGIIKNSVESLAEKGGNKFLWIESRRKDKDFIEINIRDNGMGIRPENINRIFDIFWSNKPRRIGLGLFWARDYIEGLGGSVKFESVWQEGANCILTIPVETRKYRTDYQYKE